MAVPIFLPKLGFSAKIHYAIHVFFLENIVILVIISDKNLLGSYFRMTLHISDKWTQLDNIGHDISYYKCLLV